MYGYHSDEGASSNWLVNHYYAVNREAGHERSCGYGAGADCDCSRGNFRAFLVRVEFGGQFVLVEIEKDANLANKLARRYYRGGWRVKYTTETFHTSDETYCELRETSQLQRDRIDDLRSDPLP